MRELPQKKWLVVFANIWLVIGFLALAIWLIGVFSDVVLIILFAGFIALALSRTAQALSARTGLPWVLSAAIVYIIFLIVVVGFISLIGGTIANQAPVLASQLPKIVDALQNFLNDINTIIHRFGLRINIDDLTNQLVNAIGQYSSRIFENVVGALSLVASAISGIVVTIVLSIYFLLEAPRIASASYDLIPEDWRERVRNLLGDTGNIVVRYIVGNIVTSIILGSIIAIGLYVMGVPFALLLGIITGFLDLVPIFGIPLAGALSAAVALFKSVPLALAVVVFFIAAEAFESYVVNPFIFGKAVEMSPVLIVLALLIGFQIAGVWGAIFAIPAISIVLTVIRHLAGWYFDYTGESRGIKL